MLEDPIFQLALIVVAGVAAQWIASVVRLPSILLMLLAGVLIGPILEIVDPEELLGSLLEPTVSMAVALILFEGALNIRFRQIRGLNHVVWRLVTVGVLVTWVVGAFAVAAFTDMDTEVAVAAAAIVVVSGPTVIGPMLRHMRPHRPVAPVLRWESILIDPLGAMLAVVALETVLAGAGRTAFDTVLQVLRFLAFGGAIGLAGALVILPVLRRRWVPDHLHSGITLITALSVFVLANQTEDEAGLLAVTVAGIVLANQPWVDVQHIVEFKENLRVLLLSAVFVILSAGLDLDALEAILWPALAAGAVLIVVARPLATWVSTIGSDLDTRQRVFLAAVAPRGIVAALVGSIVARDLSREGIATADQIVPFVFIVIGVTAFVYGLGAPLLGRWLGVSDSDPQGVLILGAGELEREIARALEDAGHEVLVAATARTDEYAARMDGLATFHGDVLAEGAEDDIDLSGIGKMLALTPNHEYNSLATIHYRPVFGFGNVFQLAGGHEPDAEQTRETSGMVLFGRDLAYGELVTLLREGKVVKATPLTEEFTFADYAAENPDAVPLFVVSGRGRLEPYTVEGVAEAGPGDEVLALVSDGGGSAGDEAEGSAGG